MNNTEIDESVLVTNTKENFQAVSNLLYPDTDTAPHIANEPYIRIDLSKDSAFYSTGALKQPIISIDFLMQILILPTYEAKVVFLVENLVLNDNHPWKKIYEQILRGSVYKYSEL